jgi:Flp pilus assembly protein TadB
LNARRNLARQKKRAAKDMNMDRRGRQLLIVSGGWMLAGFVCCQINSWLRLINKDL